MRELLGKTKGFSQKAIEAVLHAQMEAVLLRQSVISAEHLLLGLLRVRVDCRALRILARLGVDPERLRKAALASAPRGAGPLDPQEVIQAKLTPAAERVLLYAREEAGRFVCPSVTTPYLLLGLLRETDELAARVLVEAGVGLDRVREIVAEDPHQ